MTFETAETAVGRPTQRRVPGPAGETPAAAGPTADAETATTGAGPARARLWARLREDPARRLAVRETWRALIGSRLLIWIAGSGTVLALGHGPVRNALNPIGLTAGLGGVGNVLAAPVARWDAAWYLLVSGHGYTAHLAGVGGPALQRAAFFPLYPLAVRGLSELGPPPIVAGVLVSLAALALALYGIHRLTTLELPGISGAGGLAVAATALAPMSFFLSAVYSESLYLALSVGVIWCARHGRWALVGVLGALAGATRSAGLVLLLPAVILYLYGPRLDRPPDRPGRGPRQRRLADRPGGRWAARAGLLRPRYRLRGDLAWLALMPVGALAYTVFMAASGEGALTPFGVQEFWSRHFVGPFVGVWDGAVAAFDGARQLLSGQSTHVYFGAAGGSPSIAAEHDLMLFAFLLVSLPMIVGVLRRLPLAYGAYVIAALALPLSYPVTQEPLMSLPRFLLVLFPFSIWIGGYLAGRPRLRVAALTASALLLVLFTAEFSTWHWVA